jgi:phosphomevalonate kinase
MTTHYSAPGKLFLSGEWSILEMGTRGIVAAVNKRVHSAVDDNHSGISVSIDDFGLKNLYADFDGSKLNFAESGHDKELQFIKEAIEVALRFLADKNIKTKNFKIHTWGEDTTIEINGQRKKVGFGSSAAATVAVIASVLEYNGYTAGKEEVYKLATIAHYFAQGKVGSAFDVAASTYGGVFVYSRFDPDWLTAKMEKGEKIATIVAEKWPGFYVEELEIPNDFRLLIGWTKEEASTSAMVKQMNEFKKANKEKYEKAIKAVADCAHNAIDAWHEKDWDRLIIELQNNDQALAELGRVSGVNIKTPGLETLAELANTCGAGGKLSGAGGGDCGIAVCFQDDVESKIKHAWTNSGFSVVDATVDHAGVRKE